MINLTVVLPTFLQSEPYLFADILGNRSQSQSKNLQRAIGPMGEAMVYSLLTEQPNDRPSYAAVSAVGHGINSGQDCWLHMDPIELLVDGGNVCLVGRDHLGISEEESQQLIASINQLLFQDELQITYGNPNEWFLRLPSEPGITTYPLTEVIAKDLRAYLPKGRDQDWWHRLLTEIQMILFDHQVNKLRQKEGKPVINSVWLWGEGKVTSYALKPYTAIWSNCSLVKGLMDLHENKVPFFPIEKYSLDQLQTPGNYVVVYNHYHQDENMAVQLSQLLEYFSKGKIAQLSIYLGNGHQYHWRSNRSFLSRIFRTVR